MKKIFTLIFILIAVAAALPILGNSLMESTIESRVTELNEYGLKSHNTQTKSSYLTTTKHFEFLLEDADAFVNYLSQYSDQQIPSYVNAMLEGVLLGVDLEYSNLPFSKAVKLDIYPLEISKEMAESMRQNDAGFYKHIENFLHAKGVLYHINYNIVSEDFDGYIKDINESHTLKDGSSVHLSLLATKFEGNGQLIAPQRIATTLTALELEVKQGQEMLTFLINDLSATTNYESKSTYISALQLQNSKVVISDTANDMSLLMKGVSFGASSNAQDRFVELNSKTTVQNVTLDSQEMQISMEEFSSDVALNNLNKEIFEHIQELVSQSRASYTAVDAAELEQSLIELVSKGFVLNIADFSVKNIVLNSNENLKGFSLKSEFVLKEDASFKEKLQISPLLLLSDAEMHANMKFSKELYTKLTQQRPMSAIVAEYLKEENNNMLLNITFLNGELTLNGKALR